MLVALRPFETGQPTSRAQWAGPFCGIMKPGTMQIICSWNMPFAFKLATNRDMTNPAAIKGAPGPSALNFGVFRVDHGCVTVISRPFCSSQ